MIALYLLASHMVGDFVFQTRWQAAGKFANVQLRLEHVWWYCAAFVPVVVWRALAVESGWWQVSRPGLFLVCLFALHFATDSRRFHSTLGDVVAYRRLSEDERMDMWVEWLREAPKYEQISPWGGLWPKWPPRNPWTPLPMMIDQTLHVVQLAVLGGVFLS